MRPQRIESPEGLSELPKSSCSSQKFRNKGGCFTEQYTETKQFTGWPADCCYDMRFQFRSTEGDF